MDKSHDTTNHGKCLHVAHLNVRSMFWGGKLDMLKQQIEISGIDIFTLSETRLRKSIPDELVGIQSHHVVRLDRRWSDRNSHHNIKRGGGGGGG